MMEFFDHIDEFLLGAQQHEFLLVCYGIILYFSIYYSMAKDKFNAKDKSFRFFYWLRLHSDNIWVTFLVGLLIIVFDDEIVDLIQVEAVDKFHTLIYLGSGPLSDLLRRLIKKLVH